jgi:phosphoglycerate dehydrogenase-like enzyme
MNQLSTLRLLWPLVAVVCVIPVAAFSAELPVGVTVFQNVGDRNETLIDLDGSSFWIDPAPPFDRAGMRSLPFLHTAAAVPGPSGGSHELRPGSRRGSQEGPALTFDSELRAVDGNRSAVVFDLERAATAADAVVWLPHIRTLVTGRLCDAIGIAVGEDSDLSAWEAALERLIDLEPEIVIPGRGEVGGPELLTAQLKRLQDLQMSVDTAVEDGQSLAQASASFAAPWYGAWLEADTDAATDAFEAAFNHRAGLVPPWELLEGRRLREGESPTRDSEGWAEPRKVLWRNYWPDRLESLRLVAPGVEIIPFDSSEQAIEHVADADAIIGTATAELLAAGNSLRWVQVGSAGVERYLRIPELASGEVLLTNGQRLASEVIGEHVMALTRALARGLNRAATAKDDGVWKRREIGNNAPLTKLRGKTMLVVGLGGIGTEVARLADGAGMRVLAIRNSRRAGPPFVDRVGLGEDLPAYVAEADVVVNCLPLTDDTRGQFDAELFGLMKATAFFINVGRGGTVVTDDLIEALGDGTIAGAGLDVTDPEPLPEGHPLWKAPNLIITPHFAAWSDEGRELRWLLYRENLRRFVAGEPLLSVVDPARGY